MDTNNTDGQAKLNLEASLMQLTDILKKLGVDEFSFSEHEQQHIIDKDAAASPVLVNTFCNQIGLLYQQIVQAGMRA